MSLREPSKRKRSDEAGDGEAPSKALVPRSGDASSKSQTITNEKKMQSQYVAVRRGLSIKKCIFNSWKEAADHLDGCDSAEYRICDTIEEAAAFAFTFDEETAEAGLENSNELQVSVFHIDDFADDIMMMIFSFVCESKRVDGGTFADTQYFDHLLPCFGMASKLCRKRCIQCIQQVPVWCADHELTCGTVAGLVNLGAKLGDIEFKPEHLLDLSILLYMLKSCNSAYVTRFSFNLRSFDSRRCTEELEAAKWKLNAIEDGIPYKALQDTNTFALTDFVGFFEDWAKQTRSLRELVMDVNFEHFHISMLQSCSHSLEDLNLVLQEGHYDYSPHCDYSALTKAIDGMPCLKTLKVAAFRSGVICLKSKSLEDLRYLSPFPNQTLKCSCPSLKVLHIAMETMEWSILYNHALTLEEVIVKVKNLTGFDVNRKLAELSCTIDIMPRLKKFSLIDADVISDGIAQKSTFNVRSTTLEELKSDFALGMCQCPALKQLGNGTKIHFDQLASASSLITFPLLQNLDLHFYGSTQGVNRDLGQLSTVIENLPILTHLTLFRVLPDHGNDDIASIISLSSKTVERIDVDGLEIVDCNCPLLHTLYTTNLTSSIVCAQYLERLYIRFEKVDPMLHRFSNIVGRMPKLKELSLWGGPLDRYPIKIHSKSLESVVLDGFDVDCTCCPSLNTLEVELTKGQKLLVGKEIENLILQVDDSFDDGNFEEASVFIEQMPKLKNLDLQIWHCGEMIIKSRSLEEIDVTVGSLGLKVTECICPSLQIFRVGYDANVGGRNSGVQLAPSHDISIENSKQNTFPLSEWDFVGMEVPRSCVVKAVAEDE